MPIKVLVTGTGKMAREVLAAVTAEAELEPVGVLSRRAGEEQFPLPDGSGSIPLGSDPAALLARTHPDVAVDFTQAGYTPEVAREALKAGSRLVIGTSGLTEAFVQELDRECRERKLGAVVASNFALGAVVMAHLAGIASRFFDSAELIEMHHDGKVDSPSGTAIATARKMAESRGAPFRRAAPDRETIAGARGAALEGVTLHSVRLPGLVAHQELIFGGRGQTLTIRHDSTSRESFMPGVLLAVTEVMSRQELVLGLESLIGIE